MSNIGSLTSSHFSRIRRATFFDNCFAAAKMLFNSFRTSSSGIASNESFWDLANASSWISWNRASPSRSSCFSSAFSLTKSLICFVCSFCFLVLLHSRFLVSSFCTFSCLLVTFRFATVLESSCKACSWESLAPCLVFFRSLEEFFIRTLLGGDTSFSTEVSLWENFSVSFLSRPWGAISCFLGILTSS